MQKRLNITDDSILEELWESSSFDEDVYKLLEKYTKFQEQGKLKSNTKEVKQLTKDIYHHLTTTRNRNLITQDQQKILRQSVGAFFGLSTGSHAATTWIMESRADAIKIIDPDIISPSNLNRMRYGWNIIGKDKVDVVKEEINRLSPYTQVISTTKTTPQSQLDIITKKPKVNFIVEAIDDLPSKVKLRLLAKKYQLPFLMATDVGDNVILDIERYDISPQPKLFNDRVRNINKINFEQLSMQDKIRLAIDIVGLEDCSKEMISSMLNIGKTISTWPQLGASATIAGGMVTTAIKKILLGERVKSGRYVISLDKTLVKKPTFNQDKKRESLANKLLKKYA